MKFRISHMLLVVAGYLLLTARTCETEPLPADQSDNHREQMIHRIEKEFDVEFLIPERKSALSEKGKQKLTDLADYLCLIANKRVDPAFRQQAIATSYSLFQTNNPVFDIPVFPAGKGTLQHLIHSIEKETSTSMTFTLSDLSIQDTLNRKNDTLYMGSLACQLTVTGITASDSSILFTGPVQAEIMAIRTLKKFGNKKTRRIWQVFLGDISNIR